MSRASPARGFPALSAASKAVRASSSSRARRCFRSVIFSMWAHVRISRWSAGSPGLETRKARTLRRRLNCNSSSRAIPAPPSGDALSLGDRVRPRVLHPRPSASFLRDTFCHTRDRNQQRAEGWTNQPPPGPGRPTTEIPGRPFHVLPASRSRPAGVRPRPASTLSRTRDLPAGRPCSAISRRQEPRQECNLEHARPDRQEAGSSSTTRGQSARSASDSPRSDGASSGSSPTPERSYRRRAGFFWNAPARSNSREDRLSLATAGSPHWWTSVRQCADASWSPRWLLTRHIPLTAPPRALGGRLTPRESLTAISRVE